MPIQSNCLLLLALVGSISSCGPRAPTSFPRNSAASDLAEEAPVMPIALALREDPPLPGKGTAGWPGLGSGDAGASMHHDMAGMDMSGMDGGHDGH